MERALKLCRAEVVAVGSCTEALDALERFKPDVLVSDFGLPVGDGYGLIRKVVAVESIAAMASQEPQRARQEEKWPALTGNDV